MACGCGKKKSDQQTSLQASVQQAAEADAAFLQAEARAQRERIAAGAQPASGE